MDEDQLQKILELKTQGLSSAHTFMDRELATFLVLVIAAFLLSILLARLILQRQPKLVNERCHDCGSEMKRVHQLWWLRFVTPMLPFRTFYCRACAKKAVRVTPRVVRERRKVRREK